MVDSAYIVEEEDSEAQRIMHLRLFNEFVEWSFVNGSRPTRMLYGRSILETIGQMPMQGEFFTEPPGPVWFEDEYIPPALPVK